MQIRRCFLFTAFGRRQCGFGQYRPLCIRPVVELTYRMPLLYRSVFSFRLLFFRLILFNGFCLRRRFFPPGRLLLYWLFVYRLHFTGWRFYRFFPARLSYRLLPRRLLVLWRLHLWLPYRCFFLRYTSRLISHRLFVSYRLYRPVTPTRFVAGD